jgi:L-aspartate oxidase
MAHRGALAVLEYLGKRNPNHISLPLWVENDLQDSDERVILLHNQDELKRTLWDYVGIVRSTKRLKRARTRIRNLQSEIQEYYWNFKVDSTLLELRNMILVASLIVECALQRKESRGLHYTLDYPQQLSAPIDSCVRK